MTSTDFVDLLASVPGVSGKAMYFFPDNFTGGRVTGYEAPKILGSRALSQGLERAAKMARTLNLTLFLFDAYRPCRAVEHFVRWSQEEEDGRTKQFYPLYSRKELFEKGFIARRSGHSRGGTVDLTLEKDGVLLDMGGFFDFMDPSSHHGAEMIGKQARKNRLLLMDLMETAGFLPYENEWWHYRLKDEPYPDTYFDFPIR